MATRTGGDEDLVGARLQQRGHRACCLRAGMVRLGLGASCGLVCCTPGWATTTPDSAIPDRLTAMAASQMRFMEFSPELIKDPVG
jgi:hypothetical protein